ncbi:hypothetical protein [Bacillus pacificus]|uniref:Uncharacterized protein n=1 Tax=Bacillus pacificus TaxID=2026187 RepID=A0A1Y5YVM7_9BACI|nr:hypothetical protein [Bacillus pacificus]SMD65561.1 hypothetical protein BACERE00191_00399 [Bacillus pacificus]
MRHTRNFKNKRKKGRNVPMDKWRDTLGRVGILDLSFKWHRDYEEFGNFVEFEGYVYHGDHVLYKSKLIPGK